VTRHLICTTMLLAASAAAVAAQPATRFQAMDTNRDGRVTREEWRGSARSFARHDWNNDGVLSGDELRAGANRRGGDTAADYADEVTDWSEPHFQQLDHNNDGRISRGEWHFDIETFRRIDRDRDGLVSRAEFLGLDTVDDDRGDRFEDLDVNRDGRVTRQEWHASDDAFRWLDRDSNGVLSRVEVTGPADDDNRGDAFASLDVDRNGRVTANEWHWSREAFTRRDANRDGAISRDEFTRTVRDTGSPAYRSGYERGLAEGRQAGREDKRLRNQWDLDGQRELEQADSGYQPQHGDRADYQDGYRAGFRLGYGEGFGRRN
jgi:Ca2+-binding EF-hand superfamily protein